MAREGRAGIWPGSPGPSRSTHLPGTVCAFAHRGMVCCSAGCSLPKDVCPRGAGIQHHPACESRAAATQMTYSEALSGTVSFRGQLLARQQLPGSFRAVPVGFLPHIPVPGGYLLKGLRSHAMYGGDTLGRPVSSPRVIDQARNLRHGEWQKHIYKWCECVCIFRGLHLENLLVLPAISQTHSAPDRSLQGRPSWERKDESHVRCQSPLSSLLCCSSPRGIRHRTLRLSPSWALGTRSLSQCSFPVALVTTLLLVPQTCPLGRVISGCVRKQGRIHEHGHVFFKKW